VLQEVASCQAALFLDIGANYSMKFTCVTAAGKSALMPGVQRLLRTGLLGLALGAALPVSTAIAEGDVAAGGEKAYTCLGCHGVKHYVNTYPTYHVPLIAGQHQAYLVAALQAYRGKVRPHPTMQANANLLTDQDIEDIAAWFAAQGASK